MNPRAGVLHAALSNFREFQRWYLSETPASASTFRTQKALYAISIGAHRSANSREFEKRIDHSANVTTNVDVSTCTLHGSLPLRTSLEVRAVYR